MESTHGGRGLNVSTFEPGHLHINAATGPQAQFKRPRKHFLFYNVSFLRPGKRAADSPRPQSPRAFASVKNSTTHAIDWAEGAQRRLFEEILTH